MIAITTSPRQTNYLADCVASLHAAGATDIRIYAEPDSDLTGCDGVTIVQRETKLGAWRNWLAMCRELLDTTDDEIILTVQDDVLFSADAITKLQEHWPADTSQLGFVSLYSPSHYQRKFAVKRGVKILRYFPDRVAANRYAARRKATVHEIISNAGANKVKTRSLWGACALAFPRESLKKIIEHPIAQRWRGAGKRNPQPHEIANIDTAIGKICNALKLEMRFLTPAVCQHVGAESTLGHGGLGGRRQALIVADGLPANSRASQGAGQLAVRAGQVALRPDSDWINELPCQHRGKKIRSDACNLCGLKGTPFNVYRCDLHSECSLQPRHTRVTSCNHCRDRDVKTVSLWRVSVAIICHNYGRFLDECIDSVAAQTQTLHEVFVVDDSSTDDTPEVCRRRGMTYIRVEHRDVHRTRKTAFEHATGDVILFLDADDKLTPNYVATGCELLSDPTVAIVYSDVEYFGDRTGRSDFPTFDRARLWRDNYIHAGSLCLMAALRISRAFDVLDHAAPTHCDWMIWKRVIRAGFTAVKQKAYYLYRQHGSNMLRNSIKSDYYDRADIANEPITIFVPLSGRLDLWLDFSLLLSRLTHPRHLITLILFDTSQQSGFSARVAGWVSGCDFPDVRHVRLAVGDPGLADRERRGDDRVVADVRLAMARIYDWLRRNLATEYVFTIEDDVFPEPADVIERLMRSFDESTYSVAATYESRFHEGFIGHAKKSVGVQPSRANGFGCTVLRRELLDSIAFLDSPRHGTHAHSDYDLALYEYAAANGLGAKIDWSIPVEHRGSQSGQFVCDTRHAEQPGVDVARSHRERRVAELL